MSKKNAATHLNPKAAVCKEDNCFQPAAIRGFCRLHFLKVVAGKSQGDFTPKGKLRAVKERRSNRRNKGLEPSQFDDSVATEKVHSISELDADIDDFELQNSIDEDFKKAG